jgi:hypothetical protein
MADQKITQLTAVTSVTTDDVFPVVDDPSGTPVTKKVTFDNLQKSLGVVGKVTVTQPANGATITITDGKTLSVPVDASVSGTNTGDESQSTIKTKLGAATASVDGYATSTQITKLDGIAAGANVGVVPNAGIESATKTKITYDAKGLVTSGADATTADIADSSNKRYVTDANLVVIGNTSGTNSGDNAANTSIAATKLDDFATPDDNTDLNANTTNHGLLLKATAPAAGLTNVVAIENGETAYKNKALFDATVPSTQAFGDAAAAGSAVVAARRDHKHAMPATPTVEGTAILSTGEAGGTKFLREDGDGTCSWQAPAGGGDMLLGTAQSVTGAKTFDKDKLLVKGTSTGKTNLTTANTSETDYTATLPAKDGTVAMTADITGTNSGTNTGDETTSRINALYGDAAAFACGSVEVGHATDSTIARVSAGVLAVEGKNIALNGTSEVHTVGSIELGAASDTTISRVSAGVVAVEGVTVPTISSTSTLTNKRINPRLTTAASYTTDTGTSLDVSTTDQFEVTAQAGALKLNNPGGTAVGGQKLIVRIKDDGTARALTYDTQFRAMGTALPSTTVVNKTLYLGLIFNATDTKWDLVAAAQEA